MAVFLRKGSVGDEPPELRCQGCRRIALTGWLLVVDYIEAIADSQGIMVGCGGENDCPNNGITNAQLAVYLVKAFDLPYVP